MIRRRLAKFYAAVVIGVIAGWLAAGAGGCAADTYSEVAALKNTYSDTAERLTEFAKRGDVDKAPAELDRIAANVAGREQEVLYHAEQLNALIAGTAPAVPVEPDAPELPDPAAAG
jgi:hypothetical protein